MAAPEINPASSLNDGLLAWYLAHPAYFGGTVWPDLSGNGRDVQITRTDLTGDRWGADKPPGGFASCFNPPDVSDAYFNCPDGLVYSAGQSFTFIVRLYVTQFFGTNPGFWRIGNYFVIFQGGTGRPWIRWGGDLLRPTTGFGVTAGGWVDLAFVVHDGGGSVPTVAEFYSGGVLQHTASSAGITSAGFSVGVIGRQTVSERVAGHYSDMRFYNRALSATEIAAYYADSTGGYKQTLVSDSGPVLSSPHATNHLDPSQLLSSPHLLGSFP